MSSYFFRKLRICANLPYHVREDKHSGSVQPGGLSHSDSLSGHSTPPAHDLPLAPKTDLQMLHRAMFPADKGKGTTGWFLDFLFWIHMGQRQGGKWHSQHSRLDAGLMEICLCQHLQYEPYRDQRSCVFAVVSWPFLPQHIGLQQRFLWRNTWPLPG